jgi:hypothetical protein
MCLLFNWKTKLLALLKKLSRANSIFCLAKVYSFSFFNNVSLSSSPWILTPKASTLSLIF